MNPDRGTTASSVPTTDNGTTITARDTANILYEQSGVTAIRTFENPRPIDIPVTLAGIGTDWGRQRFSIRQLVPNADNDGYWETETEFAEDTPIELEDEDIPITEGTVHITNSDNGAVLGALRSVEMIRDALNENGYWAALEEDRFRVGDPSDGNIPIAETTRVSDPQLVWREAQIAALGDTISSLIAPVTVAPNQTQPEQQSGAEVFDNWRTEGIENCQSEDGEEYPEELLFRNGVYTESGKGIRLGYGQGEVIPPYNSSVANSKQIQILAKKEWVHTANGYTIRKYRKGVNLLPPANNQKTFRQEIDMEELYRQIVEAGANEVKARKLLRKYLVQSMNEAGIKSRCKVRLFSEITPTEAQ